MLDRIIKIAISNRFGRYIYCLFVIVLWRLGGRSLTSGCFPDLNRPQ